MTAVASPPSYPNGLTRNGWPGPGSVAMSSEDVTNRIFIAPRRSAQRSSSSSSLSSQSSTASSASISSTQSGGTATNVDIGATRRKGPRGLWPSSAKAEPVSGISSARLQPVSASALGTSAASAISALHIPQPPSQHMQQGSGNGAVRNKTDNNPPMLYLMPMNGTFERKTLTLPLSPDVLRIGRQTNAKTVPTAVNGYFDSKVLSRQHAEVWAERDGNVWIRDIKSSNGTFVNGQRLSQENRDSEPHVLYETDILELGIDIISEDQKTIVHHKVAARVEHAGPLGIPQPPPEPELDAFSQMRGRAGTNHGRLNNNLSAAAYHSKWLQPVTVEQIAKRLRKELRQAQLQSEDLQSTGAFVNAIIAKANPPPPPPQKIPVVMSKSAEVKARFSLEPPAPPPTQPLPEKPDAAKIERSSLRRSDTEKPALNSANMSPTRPDGQSIASLVEALKSARSEISSQSEKLKELEANLVKEREARTSAEQRAGSLASGSGPNTPIDDSISPSVDDQDPTMRMQQKLELLQAEMEQVRAQMESYRQRAETAELENANNKKTLAEMVENIQRRDASPSHRRRGKAAKPNGSASRSRDASATGRGHSTDSPDQEVDNDFSDDAFDEEIDSVLMKHLSRQRTAQPSDSKATSPQTLPEGIAFTEADLKTAVAEVARALRFKSTIEHPGATTAMMQRSRMEQSAPYASILGVVLLGVGMMAYLNGWKGPER